MSYAIHIRSYRKAYSRFELCVPALDVPRGTLLGVVGPNGAGKSTLLRSFLGLVRPDEGRIEVLGHRYPAGEARAREEIGFLSDDLRLYRSASLAWHVSFVRSVSPRWDERLAAELAGRMELDLEKPAGQLSHGQRVKAALFLALSRRPDLLVLDEPTTALDPAARREVLAELLRILEEEERTVVFSSHLIHDVERIADRVLFLDRGQVLLCEDTPDLLARWRRLRVEVDRGWAAPSGFVVETGAEETRVRVLLSDRWSGEEAARLAASGARIVQSDPLTLEEIFLVRMKQSGEPARAIFAEEGVR